MKDNGKYITINEASLITGKHITTFYKGIRQGRIQYKTVEDKSRSVKKVFKEDIIRLYGCQVEDGIRPGIRPSYTKVEDGIRLSKEDIKQVIGEFFEEKQTALMKPLEDQAIFLAGKYQSENKFLKERLEIFLNENEELRSDIKVLPGPAKEVVTMLEELEERNKTLKTEQENLKQTHNRKLSEVEEKLKAEEQEKERLVEIWKKELEEERKKSWWQKLWKG